MASVSLQSYGTQFSVCISWYCVTQLSVCLLLDILGTKEIQLSILFQTIFIAHILVSLAVQLPSLCLSFIHLQSVDIKSQSCISLLGPAYRNLPPHPNVCPVLGAFADKTPCLPDARKSYSAALPRQYGEGCFGRNRTMFFVMPRLGYCFWIFGCITERFAFISPLFSFNGQIGAKSINTGMYNTLKICCFFFMEHSFIGMYSWFLRMFLLFFIRLYVKCNRNRINSQGDLFTLTWSFLASLPVI